MFQFHRKMHAYDDGLTEPAADVILYAFHLGHLEQGTAGCISDFLGKEFD
jgi:hypothetical protein